MNKTTRNLKMLALTAMFAALTFAVTSLKIPVFTGYVHLGDTIIYIAASVLPVAYSLVAAGIGGALSDILGGYAQYALPTVIIKILLSICFTSKKEKMLCKRNFIAAAVCVLITSLGYYITNAVMIVLSSQPEQTILTPAVWQTALAGVPGDFVQAAVSAVAYIAAATALDKVGFKQKLA